MKCPTGYERRKAPEKVRAALIDAAAALIAEHGLSRLTIDAVARAAGVTKGGLFHHFPSKDALVQGVLDAMIAFVDEVTASKMAIDSEPHGRFTRAYLDNVLVDHRLNGTVSSRALCLATLADPAIQAIWTDWVAGRVERHAETDDNPACALVRLAADGAWLNSLRDADGAKALTPELMTRLVAMTRSSP